MKSSIFFVKGSDTLIRNLIRRLFTPYMTVYHTRDAGAFLNAKLQLEAGGILDYQVQSNISDIQFAGPVVHTIRVRKEDYNIAKTILSQKHNG